MVIADGSLDRLNAALPELDEPDHLFEGYRMVDRWQRAGTTPREAFALLGIAGQGSPCWDDVIHLVAAVSRSMWAARK